MTRARAEDWFANQTRLEEGAESIGRAQRGVALDFVVGVVPPGGARHLDDMLTRRTRISIETFDRGRTAARDIAPLVDEVLGWDADTVNREIEHYDARVDAELESQRMPDDRTADAARMGARDVRVGVRRSSTRRR